MNLFWDNDDKNIVKIKETPDLDSIKQNLINSKYSEGYSKIQKANDIEIKLGLENFLNIESSLSN